MNTYINPIFLYIHIHVGMNIDIHINAHICIPLGWLCDIPFNKATILELFIGRDIKVFLRKFTVSKEVGLSVAWDPGHSGNVTKVGLICLIIIMMMMVLINK